MFFVIITSQSSDYQAVYNLNEAKFREPPGNSKQKLFGAVVQFWYPTSYSFSIVIEITSKSHSHIIFF